MKLHTRLLIALMLDALLGTTLHGGAGGAWAGAINANLLRPVGQNLTGNFTDGGNQLAIFELGKDIVRTTLPIVETRSGQKVIYQDEDAKKSAK